MKTDLQAIERIELLPTGSILFKEGEMPVGIYVLHSGKVDLIFSGRNGMTKPLRSLAHGAIAGLSDAVSNTAHDCTATIRKTARVGVVPVGDLRRLLARKPAVWLEIAAMLSVDLDECWSSMRGAATAR